MAYFTLSLPHNKGLFTADIEDYLGIKGPIVGNPELYKTMILGAFCNYFGAFGRHPPDIQIYDMEEPTEEMQASLAPIRVIAAHAEGHWQAEEGSSPQDAYMSLATLPGAHIEVINLNVYKSQFADEADLDRAMRFLSLGRARLIFPWTTETITSYVTVGVATPRGSEESHAEE